MTDQRRIWTRKEWLAFVYAATFRTEPASAEAALVELITSVATDRTHTPAREAELS